jgi:hypothetical protein
MACNARIMGVWRSNCSATKGIFPPNTRIGRLKELLGSNGRKWLFHYYRSQENQVLKGPGELALRREIQLGIKAPCLPNSFSL